MAPKKTDSIPKKIAAKRKPVAAGSKASPPRKRTRKSKAAPYEVVQEKAYFLWESRGRPMGSPDEDWFSAKEQLEMGEQGV